MFFKPFVEKLAGDLDGQDIIFQLDWFDGQEPCFEALVMDVILNDLKTIFPYLDTTPFHAMSLVPVYKNKSIPYICC